MDFLGIGNNRFIKHMEHYIQDQDVTYRDELVLALDAVSEICVPISQNFKLITTIKHSQRKKNYD
ncbi:unnamed protein product [Paramecium octaurelia]|uniref:Uncharacterized protein n=1 Tax=Paramecium octaurelia TaxID=43137 RepID=A0A8S1YAV0_PAROT|nr:unnamed protein product [Paramecium octaurelia]